jgi:hypothetical protein
VRPVVVELVSVHEVHVPVEVDLVQIPVPHLVQGPVLLPRAVGESGRQAASHGRHRVGDTEISGHEQTTGDDKDKRTSPRGVRRLTRGGGGGTA